jgi:hypothetical protein
LSLLGRKPNHKLERVGGVLLRGEPEVVRDVGDETTGGVGPLPVPAGRDGLDGGEGDVEVLEDGDVGVLASKHREKGKKRKRGEEEREKKKKHQRNHLARPVKEGGERERRVGTYSS